MTRKQVEAIFKRRAKAQEDLNVDDLMVDYTDTSIVDSPSGGTHTGLGPIRKVFESYFKGFPDLKVHGDRLFVDGNHVVQITEIEGTDLGGFLGVPATGKSFHSSIVRVYEFKGTKIVHERRIYDFTGMLVQIGLLKAKPV